MAVEVEADIVRIFRADSFPFIDQGRALFHRDFVFELGSFGAAEEIGKRNFNHVGARSSFVFAGERAAGGVGVDFDFVGRPEAGDAGKLANAEGVGVELGRHDRAKHDQCAGNEAAAGDEGEGLARDLELYGRDGLFLFRHHASPARK